MTSRFQPPPIIKAAQALLVDVEQAVRTFDRYHKYQIGSDLRRCATSAVHTALRAWREQHDREQLTSELVWRTDELRQYLQTAKLIRAFRSFRQFEHLARQVEALGAQAGGWRRSVSPQAQNAGGHRAAPQRGQKLSTRAASAGANP